MANELEAYFNRLGYLRPHLCHNLLLIGEVCLVSKPNDDTAEKVGTIEQCLYSLGNRIKTAVILCNIGETKLLETELEDIFYFCQCMTDQYCVVK